MTSSAPIAVLVAGLLALLPMASAAAADNPLVERLATCQDSWLEWKQNNPAQLGKFASDFRGQFLPKGNEAYLVPKSSQSVLGLPLAQVYPESVGMGVGFSVLVNASFDKTRSALERKLGKTLKHCERGENMHTCALEIGDKKTIMMLAEDKANAAKTLFGCYYLYAK